MSRRNRAQKRILNPDPIYKSILISKLINYIMQDGKKSVASSIVYDTIDIIQERIDGGQIKIEEGQSAIDVIEIAIKNVEPLLEVKARRVGGANYQVPIDVSNDRRLTLAFRWIVENARERRDKNKIEDALAKELIDAYNGTGSSIKKRDDTHRMAEANKAFAHFRW